MVNSILTVTAVACAFLRNTASHATLRTADTLRGSFMRGLRTLLCATAMLAPMAMMPTGEAQVFVNIGVPPVCSYGYYEYAPYACAPVGYYGPGYFYNGVFLGIGPWAGWGYSHGWGSHRFRGGGGGRYNGGGGAAANRGNGGGASHATAARPSASRAAPRATAARPSASHAAPRATAARGGASHAAPHATAARGGGGGSRGGHQ
jgi:hypothetical protein